MTELPLNLVFHAVFVTSVNGESTTCVLTLSFVLHLHIMEHYADIMSMLLIFVINFQVMSHLRKVLCWSHYLLESMLAGEQGFQMAIMFWFVVQVFLKDFSFEKVSIHVLYASRQFEK